MPQQDRNNPLAQLLQLAQLEHLTSQGDTEQQQLEQQDQKNRTAAALQLLGLHQEAKQHEAALAETARSREAAIQGSINEAILVHTMNDPLTPLETKLGFAEKVSPQAKDYVRERHNAMVASAIKNNAEGYKNLVATGAKPEVFEAFKGGANPTKQPIPDEAWDQLKATPYVAPSVPISSPTSPGTNIGHAARLYGMALTEPVTANVLALKSLYQNHDKLGGQAKDFWNALINNPQTAK